MLNRAMFANRISYTYDLKGPSFAIDTACSSSIVALNQAVAAIRLGVCDAAIVGAVNLCLKAKSTLMPFKLNMLSKDGASKAYDACKYLIIPLINYLQITRDFQIVNVQWKQK